MGDVVQSPHPSGYLAPRGNPRLTERMYASGVAPRRGQLGYADWCLGEIVAGRCPCAGCGGTLTDSARSPSGWRHSPRCGCAHQEGWPAGLHLPEAIPNSDRCRDAAEHGAAQRREHEAHMRRLGLAEQ